MLDEFGHTKALDCENLQTQEKITLPARSVLVATGARPNVAYEFEHKGTFLKILSQNNPSFSGLSVR